MLKSFVIAFAMYSKIPMPQVKWSEKNMCYSLCFFPLVGIVIGILSILIFNIMEYFSLGNIFRGTVLTSLPLIVTGGIHFDGFLDTTDALCSYKPKEEKLKILKDPHIGAFAFMCGAIYILLSFGLFTEVTGKEIAFIAFGYVLSRILSGIALLIFPLAKKDGMAAMTKISSDKNVIFILFAEILITALLMLYINYVKAIICLLSSALAFLYYRHTALKNFGGITGDLAGFFVEICELLILLFVVLSGRI